MRPPRLFFSEQTVDHPPDGFLAILPVEVEQTRPAVPRNAISAQHRRFRERWWTSPFGPPPRLVKQILTAPRPRRRLCGVGKPGVPCPFQCERLLALAGHLERLETIAHLPHILANPSHLGTLNASEFVETAGAGFGLIGLI